MDLRAASMVLDLERRPERAVNGASSADACSVPCEAQVLILSHAEATQVLVGADLVWFGSEQADALRAEIAQRVGCQDADVALCATHTHGTPNPDPRFQYGECSPALIAHLRERILAGVDAAVANPPQAVRLMFGRATAPGVAINRRRMAWLLTGGSIGRRVQNLPNRARPIDERVSVIAFVSKQTNQPAALAVHFACHPVADPANLRGADFPGAVREALRQRFGSSLVSVFLQGFCGDVRPALLHRPRGLKDRLLQWLIGDRFRPSLADDAPEIGRRLADRAGAALGAAVVVEVGPSKTRRSSVALNDVDGQPTGHELDVTVWQWSDNLRLVFAGAEMLSGLAPRDSHTLAVGYANGMAGYIAPAEDYAGGGYEIDGFLGRFGLAKRFDPGIGAAFGRVAASTV